MKITIVVENRDHRFALEKALQSLGCVVVAIEPAPQFSIKSIAVSIVGSDPDLLFIDEVLGPGRMLGDVLYECELALPSNHVRRWRIVNNPRVFRTTVAQSSLNEWSKYTFHQLHFLLKSESSNAMISVLGQRLKSARDELRI